MDFTTKFGFPKPFLGERGANKAQGFADAMDSADAILASHDHTGGAGGQISHTNLSDIGTNSHTQIDDHLSASDNPHAVTKSQVGLGNVTNDAQLKREAGDITSFTEKGIPVSTDLVLIEDSADNYNKKKVKIGNLPTGGGGRPTPPATRVLGVWVCFMPK
jgi:hypothetical protein